MAKPRKAPAAADTLIGDALVRVFGSLEASVLKDLRAGLETVSLAADEVLYREHDPGDCMFIVIEGKVQASITEPDGRVLHVGQVGPGHGLGEASLLTRQNRTETVSASQATQLVRISGTAFDRAAAALPEMRTRIARVMLRHLRRSQVAQSVQELFGELDEETLRSVQGEIEWVELSGGDALLRQGDLDTDLYIVMSGRLAIVVNGADGRERLVDEVVRGESVGEMAILSKEARSASVYAVRDTTLIKIPQAGFDRLMEKHPQSVLNIVHVIIRRFRQTLQSARGLPHPTALALVPLSPDANFTDFAGRLAKALEPYKATAHLTSASFSHHLKAEGLDREPDADVRHYELVRWLDEQESKHDLVVYQADSTLSEWTRQCLRQADHVLLVTNADAPKQPGEIEQGVMRAGAGPISVRKSLVLLYPDGSRNPGGTRSWLAGRKLHRHHHVRLDTPDDFAHLARMLTGRAVGLALSGGGARGFAHIGVIRAMKEAGIPIDAIGGTSMGAVISAEYATGWDEKKMIDNDRTIASVLSDYTLPLVSLLSGQKFSRLLKRFFGEVEIEDLWLPYFSVSSNLTRAEMAVHRSGLLRRGVRASGTLAGLMPPLVIDGDLHVDGALFDNLPIDVMRAEVDGGFVIGVDVSPPIDLAKNAAYEDGLSGFAVLGNALNPFGEKQTYATIANIIQRAFEVGSIRDQRTRLSKEAADLYLRPPVERFGLFAQKALEEIVEVGFDDAVDKLREWAEKSGVALR
jgi:NTE family protein/lysophospholipid hydrolase